MNLRYSYKNYIKSLNHKLLLRSFIYIIISLILTSILHYFPMFFLKAKTFDSMFLLRGKVKANDNIILLTIDDKTIKDLSTNWPLHLKYYNKVLENILSDNPTVISFTFSFNQIPYDKNSAYLFENITKNSDKILFSSDLPRLDYPILNPYYIKQKEIYQNGVAIDQISRAQDNVSRRHVAKLSKIYSIEMATALKAKYIQSFDEIPNEFYTNYIGPKNTFKFISFSDVYLNKIPKNFFKNKIILVGITTNDTSENFIKTPFDTKPFSFTKLEIHANVLQNIMNKSYILESKEIYSKIITFFAILLSLLIIIEFNPIISIAFIVFLLITIYGLGFLNFIIFNKFTNIFHALLAVFLNYYLLIPFKLVQETKNRILSEKEKDAISKAEQFKTNFISLMSHNLKTPISKIYGISEMLINYPNIDDKTKHSLKIILDSSLELLNFINKILNVAKIEMNEIRINKTSKDVNNIINKAIQDLEYLSKSKNIEIVPILEPLFAIPVDNELIKQVVSIILENAIKYSKENTTITIRSQEVFPYIKIEIEDQGKGISKEDLPKIFSKFYAKNINRTSTNTGSGLGLYLAKFFVELHKGKIEVETELNKGSVFKIYLPIN